jgi:hypothetical protein
MSPSMSSQTIDNNKLVSCLGGWASIIFMIYSLITILIVVVIGGPPASVEECFSMIGDNRMAGLLRLDILTIFVMPLYYILFYSLYKVLKSVDNRLITISVILVFAGVTLFLAAPSTFSYLRLADGYNAAMDDLAKQKFLAAGEAIFSTDIWHGAGPQVGGILVQAGALIISILMLRGNVFSKLTAYTGIIMHGLDLAHIIIGFLSSTFGNMLMIIAGPLYPIWFLMIGLRLFKLCKPQQ